MRFWSARAVAVAWLSVSACSTASSPARPLAEQATARDRCAGAPARIDRALDGYRRGGDRDALALELASVESELLESMAQPEQRDDTAGLARCLAQLGHTQRIREQWQPSIETYLRAAALARQAGASDAEFEASMGQARALLFGQRAASEALPIIDHAVRLADAMPDRKHRFRALELLANAREELGNWMGAADSLTRAFAAGGAELADDLAFYGYLSRGSVYQKLAEKCDYESDFAACLAALGASRRDYQAAFEAARRLGWAELRRQAEGFISRLAVREFLIRTQQEHQSQVQQSNLFAPRRASDVLVNQRFTAGANPAMGQVLEWTESQGGLPAASDARGAYIRGSFSEMSGNLDEALGWYRRASDLLEEERGSLRDERARGDFLVDKVEFHYTTMLHLLERERYDEAFEVMERSRSRAFLDLMTTRDVSLPTPAERELYAAVVDLRSRIDRFQSCLFEVRSWRRADRACRGLAESGWASAASSRGLIPTSESAPPPDERLLQADLEQLQRRYDETRARLLAQAPRLTALIKSTPVRLVDLQRQLAADGSELIAYLALATQLVIWHVGPRSVQAVAVFLPRAELARKVDRLRSSLAHAAAPFDTLSAEELYLFAFAPIAHTIESKRLVVIPHEDLHYIPLQLLRDPKSGDYLADRYQLSYVPSASVLAALGPPAPLARPETLALADPSLASARLEASDVVARFGGRSLDESLPREVDVKKALSGAGLVHFAVHGRFVADEPLLSHLVLSPGGGDDGRLTAAEMYGLPLQANRLVVLSACETGVARSTHANEVIGMLRGLLFSGASAVLLSSWQIDDAATAEWMNAFYTAAATRPLAEAASEASAALRASPARAHPYYWAPFVLTSR